MAEAPFDRMNLISYPYSYRDYDKGLFKEKYKKCEDLDGDKVRSCKAEVRSAMKRFESGRWYDAMDEMHAFLSALDRDEAEDFKEEHSETVEMVNEWALVEDMRQI